MKFTISLCLALACAIAPALAIPVSVTVVGPDNQPLTGAKVSIVEGKTPADEKAAPREIAGENGRFTFNWDGVFPDKDKLNFYEERPYVYVRAAAPGLTTQMLALDKADSTIRLQPARSWGGLVRDVNDKPVAGVKIDLTRWNISNSDETPLADGADTPEPIGFSPLVDAWKMSELTDAQGRWQFDGLPRKASANIQLDDARFVKKSYDLNIGETDAPPLFVRAGATLTGALLDPAGAALADAPVSVGWNEGGETRTDAQGRFVLRGVEPGEVTLRSGSSYWVASSKKKWDYVVPPLEKVSAVAGETTDIGTWKAVAGLQVKALVVDEATKEPIKGARLNFYNGTTIGSDGQGVVSGRVLPAALRPDMSAIGGIYAANYVQAQIAPQTLGKDATTLDLGTIALTRGTVMSGTVRVEGEDGKTIAEAPGLRISSGALSPFAASAFINFRNGKPEFSTQALRPGNYTLQLNNGQNKSADWELVAPRQITVPPAAAATPDGLAKKPVPIEIVLKRLKPITPLLGTITGRVADAQGNGLGGAVVNARLRGGDTYTNAETLTQSDGTFRIARSDPNSFGSFAATAVEIKSIERPGYLWASQPQIETKDGATTIGNLTLKKRGAVFAGRVVNADGQGAANAWIGVLEARDYPLVQADADGKFEMSDLPLEKFTVIGAGADSFGRAQSDSSAANFVLNLAPNAASDREALAARALQGKVEWWNASQYWDVLGTQRMAQLMESLAGENERNSVAYQFGTQLAEHDAAEFLKRAPTLLELASDEGRADLEARVFALRAASDEADDRIAANAWLDEQKAEKREINARSVARLLKLAVVADKLKREDSTQWLDYAAAIAAQIKSESQTASWGTTLAQIGANAMPPFVEEMKPTVEFAFWQGASVGLAKNGDLANAKTALARLQELAQTPELIEQSKKQQWNNPAAQLDRARQSVALALAETDAEGALAMMPTSGDNYNRVTAFLVIADRAIAANDRETAEKSLGHIAAMKTGNIEKFALAASLAQQFDANLAAPLWADALQRTMPDKNNDFDFYRPSVGMWAFYYANLDAARSRVLLEREWNWRLPAAIKTKDEQYSSDGYMLSQLEIGMAAVAPARALEMRDDARAKTGKPDAAATAAIGLAAAILATPQQRARFGVDARF